MNMTTTRRHGGFALTELLLTIGIIALVLGAIAAVAITTGASQAAQNEARLMDAAANKIRSIYASTATYAGLDTAIAQGFEIYPESMGDPAVNTWGGAIVVTTPPTNPKTPTPNAARQFEIDWPNVAEESCSDLATAQTSAIGVDIDGVEVYSRGVAGLDPIDPALVSANCTEGATVTFVYGKVN